MSTLHRRAVSAHVLRHLAREQSRGRGVHLEELARDIGVRHEDIRHVVSCLHREGHMDAKRMRLTMTGLALAAAMKDCTLRAVRVPQAPPSSLNVA
jgi:hypothetical protein